MLTEKISIPELSLQSVTLLEKVNQGTIGTVYRCCVQDYSAPVVAKDIPKAKLGHMNQYFALYSRLACPHLINLLGYAQNASSCFVFMPYYEYSLDSYMKQSGALSCSAVKQVATNMAQALVYCHCKGVVHGSIKPSNVLMSVQNQCISQVVLSEVYDSCTMITDAYSPPDTSISAANDVYSFGMVLYFMASGKEPFCEHKWTTATLLKNINAGIRPTLKGIPKSIADIISKCWHSLPKDRVCAKQLFNLLQGLQ